MLKSNYRITDFMKGGRKSVDARARSESPERSKNTLQLPRTKGKAETSDEAASVSASAKSAFELQSELDLANNLIEISSVVAK